MSLTNTTSSAIEVQVSHIPDGFSVKHSFVIEIEFCRLSLDSLSGYTKAQAFSIWDSLVFLNWGSLVMDKDS